MKGLIKRILGSLTRKDETKPLVRENLEKDYDLQVRRKTCTAIQEVVLISSYLACRGHRYQIKAHFKVIDSP